MKSSACNSCLTLQIESNADIAKQCNHSRHATTLVLSMCVVTLEFEKQGKHRSPELAQHSDHQRVPGDAKVACYKRVARLHHNNAVRTFNEKPLTWEMGAGTNALTTLSCTAIPRRSGIATSFDASNY